MPPPVSPVPQVINELRVYRGADDQLWAVNTADGHGWIVAQVGDLASIGTGPPGPQGEPGTPGTPGPQGDTGPAGPQGEAGIQGIPGPKGDPGTGLVLRGTVPNAAALPTTGNTAGDMWITTDTNDCWAWDGTQWNNVGPIHGPQGDPGPQGPQGAQGPIGAQGIQGDPGPGGPPGAVGAQGVAGPQGTQGVAGPPGPTAVSIDAGNQARLGTDTKIFVPAPLVPGPWQTPTLVNGSSQAGTTIQYRLEPGNICRLSGVFQFTVSDGTSQITGLPAPANGNCYFAQTGNGGASYPAADWQLTLDQTGTMKFYIVTPAGAKSGGICGLNGISYVHA